MAKFNSKYYRKYVTSYRLVLSAILVFVFFGIEMCDTAKKNNAANIIMHPNGKAFAGSQTCKTCHENIYDTHIHTAHYLTSRQANEKTVKGNFHPGENTFVLNERLKIIMEKTNEGLFQVGYIDNKEALREPFDMVIGSGGKGQTFLYWYNTKLFQLPVSYYTPLNVWCNSPGYPTNQIMFNRTVPVRCLECHTTNFKKIGTDNNVDEYDKTQVIYGVDCERCHGPATEHVAYQTANPSEKAAKFIINPVRLTRQQKLDNCALCHSGLRENSKPSFSFVTGDKLDDFSTPDYKSDTTAQLDVHGNQYGLLTASKCFKMSTMDCSSCHNVHVDETKNLQLFSQRCMNCHNNDNHNFCTQQATEGLVLENNCVDCHMPALPSKKIFLDVQNKSKSTPDLVRTHLINIYKEQTKLYLQKIKKEKVIAKN